MAKNDGGPAFHVLDVCACGDFRRSHTNGTGRCAACECHSGGQCLKFRLFQSADEYAKRHPKHYAMLSQRDKTDGEG